MFHCYNMYHTSIPNPEMGHECSNYSQLVIIFSLGDVHQF